MTIAGAPLNSLNVLDLSALGPGPFASMMLADYGANVIAIERPNRLPFDPSKGLARGKSTLQLDLREPESIALVRRLVARADVVLESSRPGAMERLGLGPDALMAVNPALIYCRLTGWGQSGPYAQRAGHDINFLAISGALGVTGVEQPIAPPALLGDIANGSYMAVIGILLALQERTRTGKGSVVDTAIVDGAVYSLSAIFGEMAARFFSGNLGEHVLSGSAPFYGVYRCADARWFSIGAIEPQFYAAFLDALDLADVPRDSAAQWRRAGWAALRERIAAVFATRSRDEWSGIFAGIDACGAPVLAPDELKDDPHLAVRARVLEDRAGHLYAAAAPSLPNVAPSAQATEAAEITLRKRLEAFGLGDNDLATLQGRAAA